MEYEIRDMDAAVYEAGYRDVERFEPLCRQCGNYGRCWLCPPFSEESVPDFGKYKHIRLIVARFEVGGDVACDDMMTYLRPRRIELEEELLKMERECGGRAFGFSGQCPYCEVCSRSEGRGCRHPEKARPSLEAFGFDLCRTMEELFGRPLVWSGSGKRPTEVTLIGGLLYN